MGKKLDIKELFKKRAFAIPVLLLPFIVIAIIYFSSPDNKEEENQTNNVERKKGGVNTEFPNANASTNDDKMQLLQDMAVKNADGSVSVKSPEELAAMKKRTTDSIAKRDAKRRAEKEQMRRTIQSYSSLDGDPFSRATQRGKNSTKTFSAVDDFQKFKDEMDYYDSLEAEDNKKDNKKSSSVKKTVTGNTVTELSVRKASDKQSSNDFNTITKKKRKSHIKAMIDEVVKAKESSRVRIRLLDDVVLGNNIKIPAGHYLYAVVSGFSGSRINLSVTSVLLEDEIYPVRIDIYDLDGMPGLYVPKSSFKETMQKMGQQGVSSMNPAVAMTEESRLAMMGYDMISSVINSSKQVVQNKMQENKARLKYNTQVILVDGTKNN